MKDMQVKCIVYMSLACLLIPVMYSSDVNYRDHIIENILFFYNK